MIYLAVSLLYLIVNIRKVSLSFFLFGLFFLSTIAAFLTGRQPETSIDTFVYLIYSIVLYYILFNSFYRYRNITSISVDFISKKNLKIVERCVVLLGLYCLIVNVYLLVSSLQELALGMLNVSDYKARDGGFTDLISKKLPVSSLFTLTQWGSAVGYIALCFHFLYLYQNKIKKSAFFFVLSWNQFLIGIAALSRSATTEYILIYVLLFLVLYPILDKKVRKKIVTIVILTVAIVLTMFIAISSVRFGEKYRKNSQNEAVVDETNSPLLYSLLDYFSLWEENSMVVMKDYKPEYKRYGMYNSCGLAVAIQMRMSKTITVANQRKDIEERIMGYQSTQFHGPVARLLYDFGYIGTIIFILIFTSVIKRISPRKGVIKFGDLLLLPPLLTFPALFFVGNTFSSLQMNLSIIFALIIRWFIKKRVRTIARV